MAALKRDHGGGDGDPAKRARVAPPRPPPAPEIAGFLKFVDASPSPFHAVGAATAPRRGA